MDYFMESLVSNLSPNASPLQTPSPVKGRGGRQAPTRNKRKKLRSSAPDLVDEGSVDIYGDILEVEDGGPSQKDYKEQLPEEGKDVVNQCITTGHSTPDEVDSLPEKCELEMMKDRIRELTLVNDKLKSENDLLVTSKTNLTKNISSLFLTCRNEFQRKDKEIEELRDTVKGLQTKSQEETNRSSLLQVDKAEKNTAQDSSSNSHRQRSTRPSKEPLEIQQTLLAIARNEEQPRPSIHHQTQSGNPHSGGTDKGIKDLSEKLKNRRGRSGRERSRGDDNPHSRPVEDRQVSPNSGSRPRDSFSDNDRKKGRSESSECERGRSCSSGRSSSSRHRKDDGGRRDKNKTSDVSSHQASDCTTTSKMSSNNSSGKSCMSPSDDSECVQRSKDLTSGESSHVKEVEVSELIIMKSKTNDGQSKDCKIIDSESSKSKLDVKVQPVKDIAVSELIPKKSKTNDGQSKDCKIIDSKCSKSKLDVKVQQNHHEKITSTGAVSCELNVGRGDKRKGREDEEDTVDACEDKKAVEKLSKPKLQSKSCVEPKMILSLEKRKRDEDKEKKTTEMKECVSAGKTSQSKPPQSPLSDLHQIKSSISECAGESKMKIACQSGHKISENGSNFSKARVDCKPKQQSKTCVEEPKETVTVDKSKQNKDVEKTPTYMKDVPSSKTLKPSPISDSSMISERTGESKMKMSCGSGDETFNDKTFNDKTFNEARVDSNLQNSAVGFTDALKSGEPLGIQNINPSRNEGIALTSCVVSSNQDWAATMSPNGSLPFSKMKSPDRDVSKPVPSPSSNNTNSQVPTNQTWPFENRDVTNTCSQSLTSQIEHPVTLENVCNTGKSKSSSDLTIRAFPISDLKDGSDSSLFQLINPSLFTKDGDESITNKLNSASKELKSSSSASDEATSSSSGGGDAGSKESAISKSTDTTSNESEKSSTTSSSNVTVVHKGINFQSPVKSDFVWNPGSLNDEDCTNFTPPKPKKGMKQSTPVKLHITNYDSNSLTPSKSDNILCTPNLIVLGDEEATCATIMSPFKSNLVPSEFIPPGVRKEIKEVNTHFRHIRGKPEYLHSGAGPATSCGSPDLKSQVLSAGLSPNDLGFQKTISPVKKVMKCKVGGERKGEKVDIPNETLVLASSKSGVDGQGVVERSSGGDRGTDDAGSSNVCDASNIDIVVNKPVAMQPIVEKVFREVFSKKLSDFKKEMEKKARSKPRRIDLISSLKRSARRVKSCSVLGEGGSTAVCNVPSVSHDVRKNRTGNKQRLETKCSTPACDANAEEGVEEGRDQSKDDDSDRDLNDQNRFVNEWLEQSPFHCEDREKSASKANSFNSSSAMTSKSESTVGSEVCPELSFRGKIRAVSNKTQNENQQSLSQLQRSPESRTVAISPTNSCRVTSSCVEYPEHVQPVRQGFIQTNVHHRNDEAVLKSPEPDSTSEPVLRDHENPKVNSFKHAKDKGNCGTDDSASSCVNNHKESNIPDSPSKDVGHHLSSPRKSPSKLALDFNACDSGNWNKSEIRCSGAEEQFDKSQVESDLYLSCDNSEAESDDEKTLNATFVISKDQSQSEDEIVREQSVSHSTPNKTGMKTPFGGWDEMSLMESHSLSEFDKDVSLPQQNRNPLVENARLSSRTTSFSSFISVGGFSPFNLASPKLTPSHMRSPKDSLCSPLNRSSESQDSCVEDVRTPVNRSSCDVVGSREVRSQLKPDGVSASPDVNGDGQQLSRLFSFQELRQLGIVKTQFGVESSDSDSSSSSGESGSESDSEACPTPVKRNGASETTGFSPVKSPLRSSKRIAASPMKSPIVCTKSLEILKSPRVSKIRSESFHSALSSSSSSSSKQTSVSVCRRSPRKKPQKSESPQKSEKPAECGSLSQEFEKEENVACPRRQSPRRRAGPEGRGKVPARKSITKANESPVRKVVDKDQGCSGGVLMEDSTRRRRISPPKYVRIVDESSSGENILCGSVSQENDLLLKRLSVGDSELGARRRKSPLKGSGCSRSVDDSPQCSKKLENRRKNVEKRSAVDIPESVDRIDQKTEDSSDSLSKRRPLSLQEDNNVDPMLVSRATEYVQNVTKVTRRLDLDKAGVAIGAGRDSEDYKSGSECQNVSVKQSHNPIDEDNEKDSLKNRNCDDKRTNPKLEAVEVLKNNASGSDVLVVKNDVDENIASDPDDDIEDGEILDEEEESGGEDIQQGKSEKVGGDPLHITQDGCKVITDSKSKLLSRTRGKNFASRKDSNSSIHGVSPMERVYPSSSSSSSTRVGTKHENEKSCVRWPRGDKRMRSLSPLSPEPKRSRVERSDRPSNVRDRLGDNRRSRSRPPRRNNRRRSPDRGGGSRNQTRNRSPRPSSRDRDRPPTRNGPRSPLDNSSRRLSPRRGVREERNRSFRNSDDRRRETWSGRLDDSSRRDNGSAWESRNTLHNSCCRSSRSSSRGRGVSNNSEDERLLQDRRSRGECSTSRSKSKDRSSDGGHRHRDEHKKQSCPSKDDSKTTGSSSSSHTASRDNGRGRDRQERR